MNYKILEKEDINIEAFDKIATHPLQSVEWGEVRKNTGLQVFRFGGFENNNLNQVYTMTMHPIPKLGFFIGYIPKSQLPPIDFLKFLEVFCKDKKIIFVKFEPHETGNFKFKISNFRPSPHPLFPKYTQILDLTPDTKTLFDNLKSKTRYNVRYAKKNGVIVKNQSDDAGFQTFSKLYFETTKRQDYHGHDLKYHKIVWDGLKNNIAKILIAYHNDTPLAAYELFLFNNKLYYPYGGTSDTKRNLMASNLLMWEAIIFGKQMGAVEFDMWGSLPPDYDTKNPWSGFTKFKQGYGSKIVKLTGSYDLVLNPFLYSLYGIIYKIRSAIL